MSERRLLAFVGAVVFVDTMFYSVIAPLLPAFAHTLHLSRFSAGILAASYAIGTLLGSVPGGILAARAGPRFTVGVGLTLLSCSTIAFAWLHSVAALDGARVVEGLGGACSWAGGLAWIVAGAPRSRRGALIGRALAAGIAGSLLGPAIGALAAATGRSALFTAFAVLVTGLVALTRAMPPPAVEPAEEHGRITVRRVIESKLAAGMWLMGLPSIASGLINVLGPLRLHHVGASAAAIGATFLAGAAVEAVLAPVVGGMSDRRGRLVPLRAGLLPAALLLACFTLPATASVLAALIVAISAALGWCWAPAMAMLSDAADALGLDQGLAAALINMAWAGGQIAGAGGGGAAAKAAGDGLPTLVSAGACALTLVALARRVPVHSGVAH